MLYKFQASRKRRGNSRKPFTIPAGIQEKERGSCSLSDFEGTASFFVSYNYLSSVLLGHKVCLFILKSFYINILGFQIIAKSCLLIFVFIGMDCAKQCGK
jgi:hypothetical protein